MIHTICLPRPNIIFLPSDFGEKLIGPGKSFDPTISASDDKLKPDWAAVVYAGLVCSGCVICTQVVGT